MFETSIESARALWLANQRLSPREGSAFALHGGWPRAIGGASVYLQLFARDPAFRRADAD